jgi:uncharacterized protein (TIGR03083 family)
MVAMTSPSQITEAARIPYVTADEAYSLMKVELEKFLEVAEDLHPEEWAQPTACAAWTVRDIMAHQAGSYASGLGYRGLFKQLVTLPKPGQLIEDAINEQQLRERANLSTDELVAEVRSAGPVAIQNWAYGFRPFKALGIPHPIAGFLSVRHLMWVIHSRDPWMHRLDICRAIGRTFVQEAGDASGLFSSHRCASAPCSSAGRPTSPPPFA